MYFVILGSCALCFGFLVAWRARTLLAPLPKLQERVSAIAEGRSSKKVEINSQDELGRLAQEFERMVTVLAKRDQSLLEAVEARRQLERMQSEILEHLNAAVVVVDDAGIIRSANPAAARYLAIESKDIARRLADTLTFARWPELNESLETMRHTKKPLEPRTIKSADSPTTYLDVAFTPFELTTADATRGQAVLLVAEDVTLEVETKQRLIQTERLAAMGKMAAHITHEVRNPLSSIALNVELLEEQNNQSESTEVLAAIRQEVERLRQITEEYLRVVRIPDPQLQREDLSELVTSVTNFEKAHFDSSGIALDVQLAPNLPEVEIDEPQIRQALLNLLRNAEEAMPEGGRIVVETQPEGGGVAIRVRDEGVGVDPKKRERIFELFYTTKERGTGLGLAMTQQIMESHRGRVRCLPSPGRGTIFELWFPAVKITPS